MRKPRDRTRDITRFLPLLAGLAGFVAPGPASAGPPAAPAGTPPRITLHETLHLQPGDVRIERRNGIDHVLLRGGVQRDPAAPAPGGSTSGPAAVGLSTAGPASAGGSAEAGNHLPEIPITLELPDGMRIGRITIRVTAADTIRADIHASVAPGGPARAGPAGRLRGRSLGSILVTPFQVDSGQGRLLVHRSLDISVELEPAAPSTEPTFVPGREEPWAEATFGATVEWLTRRHDGSALRSPSPRRAAPPPPLRPASTGAEPFHPTFRPSLDGTPVEYLIITDTTQAAVYQQLADWKTQSGVPAVVRTVDWIRTHYPRGVDFQETLRNFIRDAAEKWGTLYVLLGGDTPVIPMRFARTTFFEGDNIPTDLYYQCLDGTWNGDGDALFGEGSSQGGPGDQADLYADVYLGRLPTNTAAEAQIAVDRILDYTRSPPRNGSLTRFLALGEVLFPAAWTPGTLIVVDGADICETALSYVPPAWDPVRLYEHCPDPAFPACILEEKSTVIDSINAGFGIVHHVGHGYINTMSVGAGNLALNNADAAGLQNADRASLLYAINCTSSAIDFSCIAERFLLNPNGGAVASIGSTRVDFPLTSWEYQNEFYRLLFQEMWTEVARAADGSRLPFIPFSNYDGTYRWMQMTSILLGDPGMQVWTAEPVDLVVNVPPQFTPGAGPFSVGVTSGGSPVPAARVCFHKPDDDYTTAWTDSSGTALVPFAPDSLGDFSITVTALNAVPWTGSGTVTPGATPHPFAAAILCVDDGTGGSAGNTDGRIDAGETVALWITLGNRGSPAADSLTATLTTGSPHVTITDGESRYPPLGAGGEAAPLDPVLIRVDRGAPDRTEVAAHLLIDDGTTLFNEEIVLRIHAPVLEWYRMAMRDSTGTGNGNGVIEPGEPFVLLPQLRNSGLGEAVAVVARLTSSDPAFVLGDSTIDFGTIPGAVQALAAPPDVFEITMADTAGLAAGSHRLTVSLYDTHSAVTPFQTLEITPPGALAAPGGLIAIGRPGAVELRFAPVIHPRLKGYNIFRSADAGGPFARINPVVADHTSYYLDEGLTPFVFYFYRVAAQDSSGNESPVSTTASASTSLPLRSGFPVTTLASANGSVTLANVDADVQLEILGAGGEVYALNGDGTEVFNGDDDGATIGALTNSGEIAFWNAPAVADVDLDGSPDIAAIAWTGALYLWTSEGVVKPGFPKDLNVAGLATPNPLGSVAMADADGDGVLELFCFVGSRIFAFHSDGTELLDGDSNPATIGVFKVTTTASSYGTPALADLNGDGRPEIIAGMRDGSVHVFETTTSAVELPGFPVVTGGSITASAAVGDLDDDGNPDIVIGSSSGSLFALKADGTPVAGWPQGIQLLQDLDSSPALGDLTGDGVPDVVCGASNGRVFAWRNDGTILPGFPVLILDPSGLVVAIRSSPCLADIDNDGVPEILVGDQNGRLHGFRADGQPLAGFPLQTENAIEGGPAAWDLDGDGLTEIIAQSFDQKIYVWETPWTFNPDASPWPMFHHDARHTGNLGGPSPTSGADPARRPPVIPGFQLTNEPNPFRGETRVHFQVGGKLGGPPGGPPGGDAPETAVRVEIFTANGRRVRVLLDRRLPAGRYSLAWDGRGDGGRALASGVYFSRVTIGTVRQQRKMILTR